MTDISDKRREAGNGEEATIIDTDGNRHEYEAVEETDYSFLAVKERDFDADVEEWRKHSVQRVIWQG